LQVTRRPKHITHMRPFMQSKVRLGGLCGNFGKCQKPPAKTLNAVSHA
jgi:hypothetical protein